MARDPATDTVALVAAAADVFSKKGYRSATIDDIALAAKISRPTVYKYTKSKGHLLDLMVAEVTQSLSEMARKVVDDCNSPPDDRLRRLLRVHVDAACAHMSFYQIILHEQAELSKRSRHRFRAWARRVTADVKDLLDECVACGSLPATLDAAVASNLMLSMTTNLYMWYNPRGPVSPNELYDQLILLIHPLAQGS
jgi:TetR/AcrR family transcriptional regulator, cholesterol catabolism regulator